MKIHLRLEQTSMPQWPRRVICALVRSHHRVALTFPPPLPGVAPEGPFPGTALVSFPGAQLLFTSTESPSRSPPHATLTSYEAWHLPSGLSGLNSPIGWGRQVTAPPPRLVLSLDELFQERCLAPDLERGEHAVHARRCDCRSCASQTKVNLAGNAAMLGSLHGWGRL